MRQLFVMTGITMLLSAAAIHAQDAPAGTSTVSNVEFQMTDNGIFGLDIARGRPGFFVPRGSQNSYIFGSGLWFGAKKYVDGEMVPLSFIAYNPNSGTGWGTPGDVYRGEDPNHIPATPILYHSTEYDHATGDPLPAFGLPSRWPLWITSQAAAVAPMNSGAFLSADGERHAGGDILGPAFMPGVDEQFIARFHDIDRSRYVPESVRTLPGFPIGLQIQQNVYGWASGRFKDVVVIEYTIINISGEVLTDCIAAELCDPDIGIGTNDGASFYDARPELRSGYAWTSTETKGAYGALVMTLLEAPVVGDDHFVDNRLRHSYESVGRAGTFQVWGIETDPYTPEQRYNFMSEGELSTVGTIGDRRALMASRKFSMRPEDTAHYTIAYFVIGGRPVAGSSAAKQLAETAQALQAAYYHGSQYQLAAVPREGDGGDTPVALLPNPAHGRANLVFTLPASGSATIGVTDVMGRSVMSRRLEKLEAGEHREELDLGGMASGAYLVTVATADGVRSARLAVVR